MASPPPDVTRLLAALLVHKLFAARPRDLDDAEGVFRRQAARLDWAYSVIWVSEFARVPGREGMPAALARLRALAVGPP